VNHIKPCPWCGCIELEIADFEMEPDAYAAQCSKCKACGPISETVLLNLQKSKVR